MGFNNYDSSITSRQTSENIKGIKNCKEKNLQKENDFCKNSSNFDWDAFRYKDTIPQSIPLTQMPLYNSSYLCQRGRMGHMDSMAHRTLAELRWWSNTITENNPHLIMKDPPPQVVITTDAAPEAWGATLEIVKNNKFFNPEKEVKKLTLMEILQSTITKDSRIF
jgi:hypothetical protein